MGVRDNDADVKDALGIPEDEPIFVLRAQDRLTVSTIARYRNYAAQIEKPELMPDAEWFKTLDEKIGEFQTWQMNHPERTKIPD